MSNDFTTFNFSDFIEHIILTQAGTPQMAEHYHLLGRCTVRPNKLFSLYEHDMSGKAFILGFSKNDELCFHESYDTKKEAFEKFVQIKKEYSDET